MPLDPNQRKDVRKAEKIAEQRDALRIAYTRRIMSEALGREWMHGLLERGHLFGASFVRGSPDLTAYNLGQQEFAKEVFWEVVNHCPTEYVLMMQEALHRELSYGQREPKPTDTAGERAGGPEPVGRVEGSEPDLDDAVWGAEAGADAEAGSTELS